MPTGLLTKPYDDPADFTGVPRNSIHYFAKPQLGFVLFNMRIIAINKRKPIHSSAKSFKPVNNCDSACISSVTGGISFTQHLRG